MVLDNTFREKITSLIDETLIPHGISSPEFEKKIWDYHYDDDFKYGQKAGLVMGLILGYYIAKYGKVPTEDELLEMVKMVELRKDEIKKSFADIHISSQKP